MSKVKSKGGKDVTKDVTTSKISKKDVGKKSKVKEPTPDLSSEESESDISGDSESEPDVQTNGKVNGNKKTAKAESSDESESDSDSEEEAPVKTNGTKLDVESDDSESDSDDASDDKPVGKKIDPESESDSDASEVETKPAKRKVEEDVVPVAKKAKTEATSANLFVGNLSWNVDEDWLRQEFAEFGELKGVRVMMDRQTGRSKGFGYVEYVEADDAANAYEAKRGTELDNRPINVDFANAKPDVPDRQENRRKSYGDQIGQPTETLFLGNLPFDVGQETVSEAFQPHGTIISVRLPTDRETGEPKGFGYVTFASIDDAKTALEAMQGGFINGRPVRLDYSQPRPQNDGGRGGFGSRGRGGFGSRGRGGFESRGRGGFDRGRGGNRGNRGSTNRGGFGDFSGRKTTF